MNDPRFGARIESEGARINSEIRHGVDRRGGISFKGFLVRLAILAVFAVPLIWWMYS